MKQSFKLNLFFDEENNIFEELIEKVIKEELMQKIKSHVCN